jgi:hypothetical protein
VLAAAVVLSGCSGAHPAARKAAAASTVKVPSADPQNPRSVADNVARRFLAAWSAGRYSDLPALVDDQTSDVAGIYTRFADRLQIDGISVTPGQLDAAGTVLPYTAVLHLHGLGDLPVSNTVRVAPRPGGYRVVFTSGTVFPGLRTGERVIRGAGTVRGRLLDASGRPLRGADRDLDLNVLGTVDATGQGAGGLERALNSRLAGPAVVAIQIVNPVSDEVLRTVKTFGTPAPAPPDITTTLDPRLQRAARAALAGAPGVAALVATDAATGAVRAAANTPITGFPTSVRGTYAPGSTFKTVTALAALMHGYTTSSQLDCPATVTAGGKQFRNQEPGSQGRMSLLTAYAQSCNTAFVNLSQALPKGSVTAAARMLGFDMPGPPLPIPSAGGTLPPPADTAEAAADAIGQGRVEASPLLMASVAAAVDDGTWRQPRLLACPSCVDTPLPAAAVAGLRQMMRAVVTSGTGTALARLSPPAYAKTGTAEYGNGSPPLTHAWMIGFRGNLAFAVYVQTGASGGKTAGPIAAAFLRTAGA